MRLTFVISIRELSFNVQTKLKGLFAQRKKLFPKHKDYGVFEIKKESDEFDGDHYDRVNEYKIRLRDFLQEKELILQQCVTAFEQCVYHFGESRFAKQMKMSFYAMLKTEGDILFEMAEYDLAIKCFKVLKD